MSNASKVFSQSHYGLSTAAAVLYAIGWLVTSRVSAASANDYVLPAVVVSASHVVEQATLAPVVVTASRDRNATSYATLDPVIVAATRDVSEVVARTAQSTPAAANVMASTVGADQAPKVKSVVARLTHWLAAPRFR